MGTFVKDSSSEGNAALGGVYKPAAFEASRWHKSSGPFSSLSWVEEFI